MIRIVTLAREYGSGGGIIARTIADKLGWTLLDGTLLSVLRSSVPIDAETVRRYDERVDSWWRRFNHNGLRAAAILAGMNPDDALFGAEAIAELTLEAILEAARIGDFVIVGRGAQCVLQGCKEALHVLIYAPWENRASRVYARAEPHHNIEELIRSTDQERASYIRTIYKRDWKDPRLYHLMINSQIGIDKAARMIVNTVGKSHSRGQFA